MNIYLIRHGETDWNKSGHIQGRTDNPLNEVGMQQAQELVTRLKDITPDVVVSSSLTRAKQTMDTVYSQLNLQCDKVIDDSFIERNFGEFEGLKGSEYNATTDFSKYKLFEHTPLVQKRAIEGLKNYFNNDNVMIFSHSHLIKATITAIDSKTTFKNLHLANCAIVHLEVIDSKIHLKEIK